MAHIQHERELAPYAPPGHSGTRNVRLVDKEFCGTFEMVLGEIEPGGEAHPHKHDVEHQVIYILSGRALVTLGSDAAVDCRAGTVIRIPPGLMHEVKAFGLEPLRLIVLYSPPLPPRDDVPLAG